MFLNYLSLWESAASEPASQEVIIPLANSTSTQTSTRSTQYWKDATCPATFAHTTKDKTTNDIALSIAAAELLIALGNANSTNLDVMTSYLNSNNPCLIGAGIAIVKATGEAALTPAIKSQLNKIVTQYKTSDPWLAASAAELLK